MKLKFIPGDGGAQFAFRQFLRIGNLEHFRLEYPEIISSIGLGLVERKIRSLQKSLGFNLMFRGHDNANTGAYAGLIAVEIKWLSDGIYDPQRERDSSLVLIGFTLLDDRKLVAAQPRQHIGLPNRGLQTPTYLNQ
jgi:hypothetical protein